MADAPKSPVSAHDRWAIPSDVPGAQTAIRRLCKLQAEVAEALDPRAVHANDCFCGESGFWPLKSPAYYRNEFTAIDFIEKATRAAIEELRG